MRKCESGKWRYRTEIDAKLALADIQHRDSSTRLHMEQRAYRCTECRGWHLTHRKAKASE